MADDPPWHSIPAECIKAWNETFQASREGLDLKSPCPVCGMPELHHWFYPWHLEEKVIRGQRFVARGSEWQWCSHCRSFQHFSGLVPDWWACDLIVDTKKLTAYPDAIEEARLANQRQHLP